MILDFSFLMTILLIILYIFTIINSKEKLNKKKRKNQFIGLIWGIFNCFENIFLL